MIMCGMWERKCKIAYTHDCIKMPLLVKYYLEITRKKLKSVIAVGIAVSGICFFSSFSLMLSMGHLLIFLKFGVFKECSECGC